ncbi:MAG: hypothetical protein M1820_000704 [Bogoriella megaspora]|nr:MAG: hypothetical protein M1820_000704 [Bogoriella megaspora]
MDPVTTAIGLVGVVTQVVDSAKKLKGYIHDFQCAPKEKSMLSQEAAFLLALLELLRNGINNASPSPSDSWIQSIQQLAMPGGYFDQIMSFVKKVEQKSRISSNPAKLISQRLKWTLDKQDIQELHDNIDRFIIRVTLALQGASLTASVSNKENIATILKATSELPHLNNSVTDIRSLIQGMAANQQAEMERKRVSDFRELIDRICPLDFAPHFYNAKGLVTPGTGKWFLESAEYQEWLKSDFGTLVGVGIPGAGKTLISTIVIESLRATRPGPDQIVLYAFCNYQDRSRHSIANVLCGLLRQVASDSEDFRMLATSSISGSSAVSTDDARAMLRLALRGYSKVFIVIDAMDEFGNSDDDIAKKDLLAELLLLRDLCSIFITSRLSFEGMITDKIAAVAAPFKLEIKAQSKDLELWMDQEIPKLRDFVARSEKLQQSIRAAVVTSVQGMFLLARLYMNALRTKLNPKQIKDALKKIPEGSGESIQIQAYEDAIARIEAQPKELKDLAFSVFSWIVFTERTLKLAELQHALAVENEDENIDEDDLFENNIFGREEILQVCAGLVAIDEVTGSVHLTHYTVQEYGRSSVHSYEVRANCLRFLRSEAYRLLPIAQRRIAETCINYLNAFLNRSIRSDPKIYNLTVLDRGVCEPGGQEVVALRKATKAKIEATVPDYAFFEYASLYWSDHARGELEEPLQGLIIRLLDPFLAKLGAVLRRTGTFFYDLSIFEDTPLAAAAELKLLGTVKYLLESGADPNGWDDLDRTPLCLGVSRGDADICRLLLEKGARIDGHLDVDLSGPKFRMSPLANAIYRTFAYGSDPTVVDLLLKYGHTDDDLYSQVLPAIEEMCLSESECEATMSFMSEKDLDVKALENDKVRQQVTRLAPSTAKRLFRSISNDKKEDDQDLEGRVSTATNLPLAAKSQT